MKHNAAINRALTPLGRRFLANQSMMLRRDWKTKIDQEAYLLEMQQRAVERPANPYDPMATEAAVLADIEATLRVTPHTMADGTPGNVLRGYLFDIRGYYWDNNPGDARRMIFAMIDSHYVPASLWAARIWSEHFS
jgi:hypothetical protein